MSNTLITPTVICKEGLDQLENMLVMGKLVNRQYVKDFAKAGSSVNIRKPVKLVANSGATLVTQDVIESNTSITVDQRHHVAWGFTTQDLTLTIDEYSERYIKPAVIQLAQKIESSLMGLYSSVPNIVGTPGTGVSTFAHLAAAAQRMDDGAVPPDNRSLVLNPASWYGVAGNLADKYVQNIAKDAITKGSVGEYMGFDTYKAQSTPVHTVGALGGSPVLNSGTLTTSGTGANLTTNTQTLTTNGWTATTATVKAGDVITLAGVNAVNPVTGTSTGVLKNFVVTADATADGSGNMTIIISPPVIITGPYKNSSAAPASNAVITIKTGTAATQYAQNLAFHKDAFALCTVPLEMPDGASWKARQTDKGISIRLIKDYDFVNDIEQVRMDILYGVKCIYPELACRVSA